MAKIKAVLFDNDGTLADTFDAIQQSMHVAMKQVLGHDIPDVELLHMVGRPLLEQMEHFAERPDQVDPLVQVYRAHNEKDLFERSPAFPGLMDALQDLQEMGYRLGVVSSKRQHLVRGGLEASGLAPFFELINGIEQSSKHKPEPDPLLDAARMMDLYPYECVYVGDSPYDIQAAHAAGMDSIAVSWGKFFTGSELLLCEPNMLINEPAQLVSAVRLID